MMFSCFSRYLEGLGESQVHYWSAQGLEASPRHMSNREKPDKKHGKPGGTKTNMANFDTVCNFNDYTWL